MRHPVRGWQSPTCRSQQHPWSDRCLPDRRLDQKSDRGLKQRHTQQAAQTGNNSHCHATSPSVNSEHTTAQHPTAHSKRHTYVCKSGSRPHSPKIPTTGQEPNTIKITCCFSIHGNNSSQSHIHLHTYTAALCQCGKLSSTRHEQLLPHNQSTTEHPST